MTSIYLATPSYNAEKYINETIESIVAQKGNFTVYYHIQDGNSTDGTVTILEKWKSYFQNNSNIHFSYTSAPDTGMYQAINKAFACFEAAPPESFIGWLNADDILMSGALAAVAAAEPFNVDWIYGCPSMIGANGEKLTRMPEPVYYPQRLVREGLADGVLWSFIQQEGCFFRKRLWDAVGGCDTSFRLAGDWDLWRRMAAVSIPVCIPRELGCFRMRPGQLSGDLAAYWREMDSVRPRSSRKKTMRALLFSPDMNALQIGADSIINTVRIGLKARVRVFLLSFGLFKTVHAIRVLLRKGKALYKRIVR